MARRLVEMGLAPERKSLLSPEGDICDLASDIADSRNRITISVATPHGRRKLYTFRRDRGGSWRASAPLGKLPNTAEPFAVRAAAASRSRQHGLGIDLDQPLGVGTVHLEDGFDPPASTLSFILDALHSGQRSEVDLGDIKTIVSQFGSRIPRLTALSDEQRQHAQPALYTQILRTLY